MIIKEYRIILPLSVEEYNCAQQWSVIQVSKDETGGNEGVEIVVNEPRKEDGVTYQHSEKIHHLKSKVPRSVRLLAPKGSLECFEECKNKYPFVKTTISNHYMKTKFEFSVQSWHKDDFGELDNVHNLSPAELNEREVIYIDIVNDPMDKRDYKESEDPSKFVPTIPGRVPLTKDWIEELKSGKNPSMPHMCIYKLVKINFVWFGLQERMEKSLHNETHRYLRAFSRRVYCWMDKWSGLTMSNIRDMEEKAKEELNVLRASGDEARGMQWI